MTQRHGVQVGHYIADALERTDDAYAEDTMRWFSFPQTFASTALLGGGIGGQAVTEGQVVAVLLDDGMYVYCGGGFVYRMTRGEGMDCVRALNFPDHPQHQGEGDRP